MPCDPRRAAGFAGVSIGLVLLLLLPAPLRAQKAVSEPRAGLEYKPPRTWLELPAGGDRGATLRLYCAPRALAGKEVTHTPLLRVMFFATGGDAGQDVVEGLPRQTPFRSLDDFVARGLGGKDVDHEPARVGGVAGQRVTARNLSGERVLIGLTMPLAGGEAAVCFEVVAMQADKIGKDVDATFASLAAVPRVPGPDREPPWRVAAWAEQDAAARAAARQRWAEDLVAAARAAPEAGFKLQKSKYWTVLAASDPAFTKKAIAAAETARAWFVQQMPELTKAAPLPAILRIFDSPDHYRAFQTTVVDAREYHAHRRELMFVNDRDLGGSTGYGMLFRAVLWQLFDDVDPGVLPALPRWLDNGCWEFLRSSRCDGRKIEFAPSDVERGRIDYQLRGKSMPALWDLMQEHIQRSPENGADEADWGYTPECARLLRWFWIDGGQQAFGRPALVSDYVRGLATAYGKIGPDPTRDVATIGLTDAQRKDRNVRFYAWRDAMLVAINDAATPLQPDAWRAINETWLAYNENYR